MLGQADAIKLIGGRSLPWAWEAPTQGRRHSDAVGLLGYSRIVFQKSLKSVHDLAPRSGGAQ
jgi:hypothetical protein